MEIEQAKAQLRSFFNNRLLTFSIREFPDGEWIAECNELPAITTGGKGEDITGKDTLIRDAIVVAAGLGSEFSHILEFKGLMPKHQLRNLFSANSMTEAEYAIC